MRFLQAQGLLGTNKWLERITFLSSTVLVPVQADVFPIGGGFFFSFLFIIPFYASAMNFDNDDANGSSDQIFDGASLAEGFEIIGPCFRSDSPNQRIVQLTLSQTAILRRNSQATPRIPAHN